MSEQKIISMLNLRNTLPRKQRILCEYLLQNIESIMTMTANEVAESVGVGKATLFRLIHQLGYDSFTELRMDLHNYALHNIRPNYWQMQQMIQNMQGDTTSPLFKAVESSISTLGNLVTLALSEAFDDAVRKILSSKQLAIVGLRSSKQVSIYFESLLLPTPLSVASLCEGEHFVFDRIAKLPTDSVVFVVARWPYTATTVQAAEYAKELGHTIILLTNNVSCLINTFADVTLLTPKEENRYSVVPFITVIEALVDDICHRLSEDTVENIKKIDSVLQKNHIIQW